MQKQIVKSIGFAVLSLLMMTAPVAGASAMGAQDTTDTNATPDSSPDTGEQTAAGPFPVGDSRCTAVVVTDICTGVAVGPENADVTVLVGRNGGLTLDCNPSETDCNQFDVQEDHGVRVDPGPNSPVLGWWIIYDVQFNGVHVLGDVESEGNPGQRVAPNWVSIPFQIIIDRVYTDRTGNLGPIVAHMVVYHDDDPTETVVEIRYAANDVSGVIVCDEGGCRG